MGCFLCTHRCTNCFLYFLGVSCIATYGFCMKLRFKEPIIYISELRNLRACLSCSLVKTMEQFLQDGCDNCEGFLKLKGNKHNVIDCTSSNFEGFIGLMCPDSSWVSKWQSLRGLKQGMYAVSVPGALPTYVIKEMKGRGVEYKKRDRSRCL